MHEQDEQLVQRAQAGNRQAFAALVERYTGSVYGLCLRMVANPSDAEDLTQETFLRLYSSLGQYRPGNGPRPWLYRIAINACLDALRKRQRRPHLVALDDDGPGPTENLVVANEPTPERAYLLREQRLAVLEAVRSLAPEYRAVVILRYQEGLSYQEMATALDVPLTTVETRLFRAKKMLRPLLTEYLPRHQEGEATVNGKEAIRRGLHA